MLSILLSSHSFSLIYVLSMFAYRLLLSVHFVFSFPCLSCLFCLFLQFLFLFSSFFIFKGWFFKAKLGLEWRRKERWVWLDFHSHQKTKKRFFFQLFSDMKLPSRSKEIGGKCFWWIKKCAIFYRFSLPSKKQKTKKDFFFSFFWYEATFTFKRN